MSQTYTPKKRFLPKTLGETIVHECTDENGDIKPRPIVTFLIGSGFSASSGIPMASQVVDLIKSKKFPKVEDPSRPAKDPSKSDYQYFMGFLTQTQQARIIRESVSKAYDEDARLFRINHAHLLLALMAKEGYINRILTVNFDPLVVEALSLVNARIRTFDVSAAGRYPQDVFEPGTVIYMHGQVHSQLMCSEEFDLEEVKQHYRDVLQEAVRDSFVIVCGYSGECDPLVDVLTNHNRYPQGIWWSSFDPESELKEGARNLLQVHQSDSHLSDQLGADNFMDQLVFEGMRLTFPEIIRDPSEGMIKSLEHIVPMKAGEHRQDVIGEAIQTLKQRQLDPATLLPSRLDIAFARTPERLRELAFRVPKNPKDALSNAIGDAFSLLAGQLLDEQKPDETLALLKQARAYGTTEAQTSWVPTQEGNALGEQAKAEPELSTQRKLFEQAYAKYAEAIRVKPDKHEAFYNWGCALAEQAQFEQELSTQRKLWEDASAKYAEAVRIEPNKDEAFYNWASALIHLGHTSTDAQEKIKYWQDALAKSEAALKIAPDTNWFNNACAHSLLGNNEKALLALQSWRTNTPSAAKPEIRDEKDFDPIRHEPAFVEFYDSLPDEPVSPKKR